MPEDIEKLKLGLSCHLKPDPDCANCPYDDIDLRCLRFLRSDCFALIKLDERMEDDLK